MPEIKTRPFLLRNFDPPGDLPGLLELMRAVEQGDHDGRDIDEEIERRYMELPGHDPVYDRWVVDQTGQPGKMLGYALLWTDSSGRAQVQILVHPRWRRHGIGSTLLAAVRRRAEKLKVRVLVSNTFATNPTAVAFLAAHSFKLQGRYTRMVASLRFRFPQAEWPVGWKVTTYAEVQNLDELVHAFNKCYAGLWGHNEVGPDEMSEWLVEWDPRYLFLVYDERAKIAGVCRAGADPLMAYIDGPGIAPRHRSPEMYLRLLHTALNALSAAAGQSVELESWGDDPATLAAYETAGLRIARQVDTHARWLKEA